MAILESVLLKIGTEVAKKVYEIQLKERLNRGTLEDTLSRRGFGLLDCRRAKRQFERMAESIADTLQPLLDVEAPNLPTNELNAALLTVHDSFKTSQINMDSLLGVDLDPVQLEHQVRSSSAAIFRSATLSQDGTFVYNLVLREACNYVIEIATSLPSLNGHAFRELLVRETSILELVKEVLSRMPSASSKDSGDADVEFELQYRRSIARSLDVLELFGVNLSESSKRYSLEVAYISLSASYPYNDSDKNLGGSGNKTEERNLDRSEQLELGQKITNELLSDSERVESVLFKFPKLVIKGEAGSGKTTLLQWLTVNSARHKLPEEMTDRRDTIPFFLQLRRYVGTALPRPEEFLRHTVPSIEGVMPPGWVHRQLIRGRAIVMVDGLDESPESQRSDIMNWLDELATNYDICRFIVTSRPSAVTNTWSDRLGFVGVELQPMSVPDIRSFIDHWHDAAIAITTTDDDRNILSQYCSQLKETVLSTPPIRSLATSPLLCAMLCALNRDRRTRLPRDRMELYRIALEMLLDRRDIERNVDADIPELSLREKEILLQNLAYWLILNDQSDTTVESAVEVIQRKLILMPHIKSSVPEVFRHLLVRSGLLREPVVGRVDFIHRTFQEYLGAKEALDQGNIPMLISRAHEDHWREVTILACGHASPTQRCSLVNGLLDRGDRDKDLRHVLHLVAVACLETAVELDPKIVERIHKSLGGLVPPNSVSEARALASAGELAVSSLASFSNSKATIAAACVRSLSLIGTDSALTALQHYGADSRITVLKELVRAWRSFDLDRFARDVLARSPLVGGRLTITDPELLEPSKILPNLRRLECVFRNRIDNLESLTGRAEVDAIVLMGNNKIDDLRPLQTLPHIVSLDLESCTQITSFEPLSSLKGLTWLDLSDTQISTLEVLPEGGRLRTLYLRGCERLASLRGLGRQVDLRQLHISAHASVDVEEISELPNLEDLRLTQCNIRTLDFLPTRAPLRSLQLTNVELLRSDRLAGLSIHWLSLLLANSTDLGESLAAVEDVRTITLVGVRSALDHQLSTSLVTANLHQLNISDLAFLPSSIQSLTIRECPSLHDISQVAEMPSLQYVSIRNCEKLSDLSPLKHLRGRLDLDTRLSASLHAVPIDSNKNAQ